MEIIQQIGSYAGLAAIVGLAVMSALYFSQARDLRRLRESKSAEEARSPAQPAKRPTAAGAGAGVEKGETPAGPAAQPATAPTAPAAAQPATAAATQPAGPAKPAPGAPSPSPAPDKPAPGAPSRPPAVARPAAAASSQRPATAVAPGTAAAQAGAGAGPQKTQGEGSGPATATPAGPGASPGARPPGAGGGNDSAVRPLPRRLADQSSAGTTGPAVTPATRRPPWYRRLAPRYIVLIVAAVLVVATGAAFAVSALTGAGEGARDQAADADRGGSRDRPPLDPSTVTVAVLNGTSTVGAAQQTADIVQGAGFTRGTVANDSEPSAESAVLFAKGQQQAAREVGKELDISQVEPIDATTEGLAGDADVVVVVGADRT